MMRSLKLPTLCATLVAIMSVASVSLADDATGSTSVTGTTTVTTPSAPSVPATSQTVTTVGTPPPATPPTTPATVTTPTSTTTTTAGDPSMSPTYTAPSDTTTVVDHRRPNRALLITGGALFVSTYVTTAAIAGGEGSIRDHDLYIPVAGPWINLATRGTDQSTNTRDTLLIAGSGVLQGVGLGMAVASFIIPETTNVATISAGPVKMTLTPTASAGAGGVGAFGSF